MKFWETYETVTASPQETESGAMSCLGTGASNRASTVVAGSDLAASERKTERSISEEGKGGKKTVTVDGCYKKVFLPAGLGTRR